jgi:hypothetical protein
MRDVRKWQLEEVAIKGMCALPHGKIRRKSSGVYRQTAGSKPAISSTDGVEAARSKIKRGVHRPTQPWAIVAAVRRGTGGNGAGMLIIN